ncbi:hypothetical protein [Streptomyces sp. NPDC058424]|uniref:hypothetical protein n=1 Tax=Streptomyces sp. NPDC058424 TaxID=3346491 RepID=UPI0036608D6C
MSTPDLGMPHWLATHQGLSLPDRRSREAATANVNYVQEGTTDHFTVYYDSTLVTGEDLAAAVLAACEDDFTALSRYFYGFTVPIFFEVRIDNSYIVNHDGGCGSAFFHISAFDGGNPEWINWANAALIADVLEDGQNLGWDCLKSNGAALSNMLATARHSAQPGIPVVNYWMNSLREDYINQSVDYRTEPDYLLAFGCSTLFLNYLRYQVGASIESIVRAGGATLALTYQNVTGESDAFGPFADLLDQHFEVGHPVELPSENPFPLTASVGMGRHGVGAASSGTTTALAAADVIGRVSYTWWPLGAGRQGWHGFDDYVLSAPGLPPAAALVGPNNDYLFVTAADANGAIWVNQARLGRVSVGWKGPLTGLTSPWEPGAASGGNTSVVVAADASGQVFYNWWLLGDATHGWQPLLDTSAQAAAAPAAALFGPNHDYLMVFIRDGNGELWFNQGQIGGPFGGWQRVTGLTTDHAPGAAAAANIRVIVATDATDDPKTSGQVAYTWWQGGGNQHDWRPLDPGVRGAAKPAAALLDQGNGYLFVVVPTKPAFPGVDPGLAVNQGELGGNFVGWEQL